MTTIYFPFRTNVHYWDLDALELNLESRIKLSALIYDDLIFDNGAYEAIIGPEMSTEFLIPTMDQVPDGFLDDELPREGGEFAIQFGEFSMSSPAQRRYRLCYRKMLDDIGITDFDWIGFINVALKEKGENAVKKLAEQDLSIFHDGELETYFVNSYILKSINHDFFIGNMFDWDMNLDPMHEVYLRQKLELFSANNRDENSLVDFDLVFPRLPDLSLVSWDEIIDARNNPTAVEFRQRFSKVTRDVRSTFLAGETVDAVRYQVMQWREEQLLKEIENLLTPKKKTIKDIAVNIAFVFGSFLPFIGPIVGVTDAVRGVLEPIADGIEQSKTLGAAFVRQKKIK